MDTAAQRHADLIKDQLRRGPLPAKALMRALNASQPTVSRALKVLGDEIATIGSARSIQYALKDTARADLQANVYRVSAEGQLKVLGTLVPVRPEGFVMQQADGKSSFFDGLPWWLHDMRPQGYLGRAFNRRHGQQLQLPDQLNLWTDGHALRAILLQGADLPGNLLLGEGAQALFLNAPDPAPIALEDKLTAYAELADLAARGDLPGSSAGGEQPKFTTYAYTEGGTACHVLVKFTSELASPISARWRDLLLAEHHALRVLHDFGVAASQSNLIDTEAQRFLEVHRFDRVGPRGRRALHSLGALDAEFVGAGGSWPVVARKLAQEGVIRPEAVDGANLLWAFGRLIGNTDMHSGNLSFIGDRGRPFSLAPAYDMTPMAFAPTSAGDLPQRPLHLDINDQVPAGAWIAALPMAQEFLNRLGPDPRLSRGFQACLVQLQAHLGAAADRINRLDPV